MVEQRTQFVLDFLRTHVGYTGADFKFDSSANMYTNPYINHCYKLFLSKGEEKQR